MSGEALLKESERGNLAEVTRLLLEGVDVNHRDKVYDIYNIIR
jgi:hypothetical protein